MATTSEHPSPQPITAGNRGPRRLMNSLVAAAQRLTDHNLARNNKTAAQEWQADAWDMFDLVGEQHFLATTLANRLGQARLFVGQLAEDPTDPPEPVEGGPAADVFDAFAGSPAAKAQLVARLGVNLFVAGDGWLVGIPRHLMPDYHPDPASSNPAGSPDGVRPAVAPAGVPPAGQGAAPAVGQGVGPVVPYGPDGEQVLALSDLEWRMLSVSEVTFDQNRVTLKLGQGKEDEVDTAADNIFLVRVWRPHPKAWWEADSPTRASLPVLRELVGLTEHVSAQVDSRLAGAGVFIVPNSARDAFLTRAGDPADAEDEADPFTEALMTAMLTPIRDRSNASAYVPLVVPVPDASADKFKHLTFSSELDAESRNLREEAIRRLALGQDCPPEILLGVGDMNHWGGWLVREDTITTHIEPPLALICDALTTQFLRPVLIQQGMEPDEADTYVISYDVTHMIVRPNQTQDAKDAHAAGVISDEALRDALGFSDHDAPAVAEDDPAITLAFDLVKNAPSLAQQPGIPALVEQIRAVLDGTPAPTPAADPEVDPAAGGGDGPSETINDVDLPDDDTNAPIDGPQPEPDGYVIKAPPPIKMPQFPVPTGGH